MLDLLISTAHAQSAPGGPSPGGQGFEMLLFFGSIIAIWWFLVIRPQTKSAQKHAAMVAALKKGDQVVTASGIFGKVAWRPKMWVDVCEYVLHKAKRRRKRDVLAWIRDVMVSAWRSCKATSAAAFRDELARVLVDMAGVCCPLCAAASSKL